MVVEIEVTVVVVVLVVGMTSVVVVFTPGVVINVEVVVARLSRVEVGAMTIDVAVDVDVTHTPA